MVPGMYQRYMFLARCGCVFLNGTPKLPSLSYMATGDRSDDSNERSWRMKNKRVVKGELTACSVLLAKYLQC